MREARPGYYLYEGEMGTRGPSPLTHTTSYAGTREIMRRGQGLSSTIVFLLGLTLPAAAAFSSRGAKGLQ